MATGEAARGREAVNPGRVEIRKCQGLEDLRACVALQKEVWNFSDAELMPLRLFVVAEKIGGQVMGAFDGAELAGFVLALPGERAGRAYLHSQMLAVKPRYRNAGLGRRLKLFQRADALQRGFELMEWTFEPLEIKNAYLNIEKLGAIARRYSVNQYGLTSSPLHGGLASDRLIAEWWLKSGRVESVLAGRGRPEFASQETIAVPAEIYAWKESAKDRAREVLEGNRKRFLKAFGQGLAVLGYERDREGNGTFLLGKCAET